LPGLSGGLGLALELAAVGWHIVPLSPVSKRPLANCPACRDKPAGPPHRIEDCPCLPAGRWCHGVRAATTDPARLTAWWHDEPAAVPGVAAGSSGLVLIDIDTHGDPLPADLATGLLPGIDLAAEPISPHAWRHRALFLDGRDSLQLLAQLRGGPHPWPPGPGHQPVTVATPSGGRHLWYRAPAGNLRQVLSDPAGRHGLAWQVDIKAGWSYGIAPGATTGAGTYAVLAGTVAVPGEIPGWLAREVTRVAAARPTAPSAAPLLSAAGAPGRGVTYLDTVIRRGAARLTAMDDGRKRALSALAYQAGGLLAWAGLTAEHVTPRLIDVGTASGLKPADAARIVRRAIANGIAQPLMPPTAREKRAV